jgi:AcrR family transcriptional regulator
MPRPSGGSAGKAATEQTRDTLIRVARELFSRHGYAGAGTETIVHAASLSRGALYHHFTDKRDLFEAVYEQLDRELHGRVMERWRVSAALPTWERLRGCVHLYLDAMTDPATQQVMLIDAPSVLGARRWREPGAEATLGALIDGLRVSATEGLLADDVSVEAAAHVLIGVFSDAAHWIAAAEHPRRARDEAGLLVDRILDGLRARQVPTPARATTGV